MPFALGVAVAELFARIAAALGGGTIGGVSPLPPGSPNPPPPQPPPNPPPTGGPPIIPEPPVQGTPLPQGPLPTVPTPGVPLVPVDDGPVNCSPIPFADRLALYALEVRGQEVAPIPITSYTPEVLPTMPALTTQAQGTPIEASDVFRFRAVSTSDVVAVSYYGRVMLSNGQIVPFSRTLTTTTANTLFETTMQGATGYLLSTAASVPINSITNGAVNAVGEIGRVEGGEFKPHTLLFSGQLDDLTPLSVNAAGVAAPVNSPTFLFVTMSAAVAGISTTTITPSTGKRVRICHLSSDYIASAVASNRQLYVRLRTGGATYHEGIAPQYLLASEDGVFRASMGLNSFSPTGSIPGGFREFAINLPETLYFTTPVDVVAGCYGVQAGDTTVVGFIRYEES